MIHASTLQFHKVKGSSFFTGLLVSRQGSQALRLQEAKFGVPPFHDPSCGDPGLQQGSSKVASKVPGRFQQGSSKVASKVPARFQDCSGFSGRAFSCHQSPAPEIETQEIRCWELTSRNFLSCFKKVQIQNRFKLKNGKE